MRYVDAHVHLSDPEYGEYVDNAIEDARRSDVVALVSNSTNLQTSLRSIELAERHPRFVYATVGIHPWNVKGLLQNELEQTMDLATSYARSREVVAIGEIGLDYKYVNGGRKELVRKQHEIFCEMLRLSEELSLPAIIHSRGTTQEIMDILASYNIRKVLLHWFSNPIELLPRITERGYYITEGPATLFSTDVQEIVRQVPLKSLLTETDGPVRFFKPPFNGEMTTPAVIPLIVDAIAEIKREERMQVAEQIYRNFMAFFDKG